MEDIIVEVLNEKTIKIETSGMSQSILKIDKGDKIKLSSGVDNHELAYEAVITETGEGYVHAESSNENLIKTITQNSNVDVHFLLSDYIYKMQSRALDLVESSNLVDRLLVCDELPLKANKVVVPEHFVDEDVEGNKEQAMAVKAIVERTSGKNQVRTVLIHPTRTWVHILPMIFYPSFLILQ